MVRVLHVLPHRGGGAETFIDVLEGMDGVEHVRMPLASGSAPSAAPSILRAWPGIARAAREADVVHAHGDVAAALAAPLRPLVWNTHGLHMLRRAPRFAAAVRATVRRAAVTICSSQAEVDDLAAIGATARVQTILNAVPLPPPRTREWGGVAVYVGELSERKDPLTAARAARAAGMPLLAAGDGPLREAVAAEGAEMLGHVSDVQAVLDRADVFIFPSTREGMALAVLEAMAAGLAMVVSDAGPNVQAVGDAGLVAPAGDVAAFAAALRAATPAHGAAARERARTVFAPERLHTEMRALYEDAVRAPGRGGGGGGA